MLGCFPKLPPPPLIGKNPGYVPEQKIFVNLNFIENFDESTKFFKKLRSALNRKSPQGQRKLKSLIEDGPKGSNDLREETFER